MPELVDILEGLVDAHGTQHLVQLLAVVARLKAEHVMETWQDEGLAGAWNDAARELDAASQGPAIVRLAATEGR